VTVYIFGQLSAVDIARAPRVSRAGGIRSGLLFYRIPSLQLEQIGFDSAGAAVRSCAPDRHHYRRRCELEGNAWGIPARIDWAG